MKTEGLAKQAKTLEMLVRRLNKIVAPEAFVARDGGELEWLDDEGDRLELYGAKMVERLLMPLNDARLYDFVLATSSTRSRAFDQGAKYGERRARAELIGAVHELLGIGKNVQAINNVGVQ